MILSPTPPVECLSVVGFDRPEKSRRVPVATMARVMSRTSSRLMPLRKIAIVMADICSSAT